MEFATLPPRRTVISRSEHAKTFLTRAMRSWLRFIFGTGQRITPKQGGEGLSLSGAFPATANISIESLVVRQSHYPPSYIFLLLPPVAELSTFINL